MAKNENSGLRLKGLMNEPWKSKLQTRDHEGGYLHLAASRINSPQVHMDPH